MKKHSAIALLVILCSTNLFCEYDFSSPEKTTLQAMSFIQNQKWEDLYNCFTSETTYRLENLTKAYLGIILFFAKKKIDDKDALNRELQSLTGKAYFVRLLQYAYWNEPRAFKFQEINFGAAVFSDNEVYMDLELLDIKDKKRKEKIYFKKEGNKYLADMAAVLKKYDKR